MNNISLDAVKMPDNAIEGDCVRIGNSIYAYLGYATKVKRHKKGSRKVVDKEFFQLKKKFQMDRYGNWKKVDNDVIKLKVDQPRLLTKFNYTRVIFCTNESKTMETFFQNC